MELIVPKKQIYQELSAAFSQLGAGPVLLHSDILRVGMLDGLRDRDTMCADYETLLGEVLGDRPLLIPTFNYDFCKDGIYDIQHSPSQVGALTDYYRRHYWRERTKTPVFHFCIRNNHTFGLEPVSNCFAFKSTFAELVAQNGLVVFLGADFSCNTFIHHVEELSNVDYRFLKTFDGVIIDGEERARVKLIYRVRPLEPPNAVVYDWQRLEQDLVEKGLLHVFPLGKGQLKAYRAAAVAAYWYTSISRDPRFLLAN